MRPVPAPADGGWSPPAGEELFGTWTGLQLFFGVTRAPSETGSLYITGKRCVWLPARGAAPAATGYEVDWEAVSAHGTPQSCAEFAQPHLWMMLDCNAEEAPPGKETHATCSEVRFVPEESEGCDAILTELFEAFSKAACGLPQDAPAASPATGDFSRKRKRTEMETGGEEACYAAFEQMADLQGLAGMDIEAMLAEAGSALSPEERERRLADWDSKLVVLHDDGEVAE
eukprot:TRINITY_DN15386_c0_g1_i1.p1 TRINITY_DN15386_c0_g1~~TRINITY_DN15386_c0_g1_i1.p1  ORF type:complete len:229 (+),score=90.19 TRINITY_DN15386_c0_g1_i1:228-914(+)